MLRGPASSFMSVDCFLDTNVIVYAATGRGVEDRKRERALDLIETCEFGLSAQVLQEFYVTVVHKVEIPLTPTEALEWIEQLERSAVSTQPSRKSSS